MSVWEKVEEQTTDLINKSNFKQCYQLIDNYKSKYPKSVFLQILESYIKYKQSPTKFQYDTSLVSKYDMNNGKLYTIDQDALGLLHKFFFELEKYEDALHVFERANSRQPSFKISYLWFDYSLKDCNFKHLGKSSLQLSKFPKDSVQQPREYLFWNAISTVALFKYQNYRVTSQEAKILPLLTYKNLNNLKPFKSTQEIIVYCTMCEELFQGDTEKSQEIVNTILPQFDNSVDLYMKNFFLRNVKKDNHDLIFNTCSKLLKSLDDYELMKNIVISGNALGKNKQDLYDLIDGLVGSKSRNARLIRFEIDLAYDDKINQQSLQYYLERFHNRPCCVADITHYRKHLSDDVLINTFASVDTKSDLIHDSNLFKLKLSDVKPVEYFNKHRTTMKTKSSTDYSLCSTFILDLIKKTVMGSTTDLGDILYVVSLLENYQKEDSNNYDTKVWLIAMYMYLGLTPMAYSYYQDLSVKNVQVDSMDYLIYSRYSSLFPNKTHDYLNKTLVKNNALYDDSLQRISQFINISFDRKSYIKILGMLEFQNALLTSVTRFGKRCELMNMTYICNDKRTTLLESLKNDLRQIESSGDIKFTDNRDWSIFGFPEHLHKEKLPESLSMLYIDEPWILYQLIKSFMIEAIPTGKESSMVTRLRNLLPKDAKLEQHMTPVEVMSYKVIDDIYSNNGDNISQLVSEIDINITGIASWRLIETYLVSISTLKTLDNMKRIKDKDQKALIKQKLSGLRSNCDDLFVSYKSAIKNACDNLQNGDRHETLVSLGYAPIASDNLISTLVEVQKSVRNL
ncbi:hypothetical protein C6P45_002863 [Maudiozyma exigua]|uniref:Uncharacterized protein n=1 Tax=Maudiozyma exigua TaxID=34358 RepID=A0A9P7BCI5_MAUEX|nr:hypothetical protein C6P45_002863 [Kazachstania exigua]